MLCYCVIKAFPDLFTLRGRNRTRLPLPSLTLNRGPLTGDWIFPYNRTFPCYRFEKRWPQPCFCLNKGLSGLLGDQENDWRPGIEFLVAHPQQEPLLSPGLQRHVQTATCYFPLYSCLSNSHWGGREGRAVKKELSVVIAGHMKLCISWSVSCNTPLGHTGSLDWFLWDSGGKSSIPCWEI